MSEPIRVAQMMTEMDFGGVEMVVMNYYRNIDRNKVQFDFFALEGSTIPMKEEIERLGGRVYVVPKYTHLFKYEKRIIKIFKENNYKIVHSHMNTLSVFSLLGAKIAGVPVRIAHNHATADRGDLKKNSFKYVLRPFSRIFPTHLCACTKHAGKWLFGNKAKFKVFNNAIDLEKYKYNEETRILLRKELGLEGKKVIGHIGRFCYSKNHDFLIEIFNEILKKEPNAVLILIGEGELEQEVKEKIRKLKVEDKVLFLGRRADAYKYYQAMDCFVLPSRSEGLGMVAIEAQAAGLSVVCSTEVPKEAKVTDLISFIDVKAPVNYWVNAILRSRERIDETESICNNGYEIHNAAKKLLNFYIKLYNKKQ